MSAAETSPLPAAEPVKVERGGRVFAGRHCDDGYDFMEAAASDGWRPVAAWGADGWDLGDWPYLVFMFRDRRACVRCGASTSDGRAGELCNDAGLTAGHSFADVFQRASYCEGDTTIETFASGADREASTDALALAQWRRENEAWVAGVTDDAVPVRLRGPYARYVPEATS